MTAVIVLVLVVCAAAAVLALCPSSADGEGGTVRVYDFTTHAVSLIPKDDLDPSFMQVQVQGIEGLVWVDSEHLKQRKISHPPFGEDRLELIREIKSRIDEVYPQSIKEWEDGFRRDANPDSEIAMWLSVARCYSRLAPEWPDEAARKDVLYVLLSCTSRDRKDVLYGIELSVLTRGQARAVVDAFFGDQ